MGLCGLGRLTFHHVQISVACSALPHWHNRDSCRLGPLCTKHHHGVLARLTRTLQINCEWSPLEYMAAGGPALPLCWALGWLIWTVSLIGLRDAPVPGDTIFECVRLYS